MSHIVSIAIAEGNVPEIFYYHFTWLQFNVGNGSLKTIFECACRPHVKSIGVIYPRTRKNKTGVLDMCISCGCGKPNEDHGNKDLITRAELDKAAKAAGMSTEDAAKNIASSVGLNCKK